MTQAPATDLWHCLRHEDARAAIDWLAEAFGFETLAVHEGEGGRIEHAELVAGNAGVMLGDARDPGHNAFQDESGLTTPRRAGGVTASVYVIVSDPDAHYARAKAAGAEIVVELEDEDYGSRGYTAKDLEGNVWTFGTYRPRAVNGARAAHLSGLARRA